MITNAIIGLGAVIISLILNVFPLSSGFSSDVTTAVTYFGGYLGILSPIVPVSTLLALLGLVIFFELTVFGFKAFRWVFSHVPFIGGRS